MRVAAQEAECPDVGVWTRFTRDASVAWPSGPSKQVVLPQRQVPVLFLGRWHVTLDLPAACPRACPKGRSSPPPSSDAQGPGSVSGGRARGAPVPNVGICRGWTEAAARRPGSTGPCRERTGHFGPPPSGSRERCPQGRCPRRGTGDRTWASLRASTCAQSPTLLGGGVCP